MNQAQYVIKPFPDYPEIEVRFLWGKFDAMRLGNGSAGSNAETVTFCMLKRGNRILGTGSVVETKDVSADNLSGKKLAFKRASQGFIEALDAMQQEGLAVLVDRSYISSKLGDAMKVELREEGAEDTLEGEPPPKRRGRGRPKKITEDMAK